MTLRAMSMLVIACTLGLNLALAAPPPPDQHWRRYDVAAGGPFIATTVPVVQPPMTVGGVSVPVTPGAASAYVVVNDDTGSKVAARYMFADTAGQEISSGEFCRSSTLPIPAGAVRVWIYPSMLVLPCPVQGTSGPAVAGQVYVRFIP